MTKLLASLIAFAVGRRSRRGATAIATASDVPFGQHTLAGGIAIGFGMLVGLVAGGLGAIILA
jgi:hypothetical protein